MSTGGVLHSEPMNTMTAQPQTHPLRRLAQELLPGVVLPQHVRFGVALRTPASVAPVVVRNAASQAVVLDTQLPTVPTERCVLTVMVDAIARIDLPVRLSVAPSRELVARVDGVPLVLRRRFTLNAQLSAALAAAA